MYLRNVAKSGLVGVFCVYVCVWAGVGERMGGDCRGLLGARGQGEKGKIGYVSKGTKC